LKSVGVHLFKKKKKTEKSWQKCNEEAKRQKGKKQKSKFNTVVFHIPEYCLSFLSLKLRLGKPTLIIKQNKKKTSVAV
jgi:hypothetical protein